MDYKASLIISVYNNIPFLKAILDSLSYQTEQSFEVIITEDAEHEDMRHFIETYPFVNDHQHLTQPDIGWRKELALNRAVKASHSDYLIFIDGDCVLHPHFIEAHLDMRAENMILAGKRVSLNKQLTSLLISDSTEVLNMPRYLSKALFKRDGVRHLEDGFYIPRYNPLRHIIKNTKISHLIGCNMSLYKTAIEQINGFDEDYTLPAVGEDGDIYWRLMAAGYKCRTIRNIAVQYHLNHPKNWHNQDINLNKMFEKQSRKEYICKNGLNKL